MSSLDLQSFVAQIRAEQRLTHEIPGFDPGNGNAAARFLFVLEAPGPRAVETGVVSFENPDATARNFRAQLAAAGVARADIAIWNVVPWYLGASDRSRIRPAIGRDIAVGTTYLLRLLPLLPRLTAIVLVGTAARRAHVALSASTSARILACHHPSPKVINASSAAAAENIAVFKFMLACSDAR